MSFGPTPWISTYVVGDGNPERSTRALTRGDFRVERVALRPGVMRGSYTFVTLASEDDAKLDVSGVEEGYTYASVPVAVTPKGEQEEFEVEVGEFGLDAELEAFKGR